MFEVARSFQVLNKYFLASDATAVCENLCEWGQHVTEQNNPNGDLWKEFMDENSEDLDPKLVKSNRTDGSEWSGKYCRRSRPRTEVKGSSNYNEESGVAD